jgi:DNA-binding SARP family transcriptional activator
MEIRLLGPVELVSERGAVPIGSAKQRALLAFLALHPQRLLTYEVLIDGLWGDDPPDNTVEALRFHVSRLRGILRQVDDSDRLRTRPRGYQLVLDEDAVDALRFERAIAGARSARSESASPDVVSGVFRDALDLWVGPALADINGEPFVVGERRRLEELRVAATEDYFAAELAGSRHAQAVAELERMVENHPLRERLWELLITALYRSDRQADALAAYQRLRRILADELGIEPSAALRELEHRVLVQDTGLARPPATGPGAVWHANGDGPPAAPTDTAPAPRGTTRWPRGLAAVSLALGIVALVLFWLGTAAIPLAVAAMASGAIAATRSTGSHQQTRSTATAGIVTGIVALAAAVAPFLTPDDTPHAQTNPTEQPSDAESTSRTAPSTTATPEDRTTVSNDFYVHDELEPVAGTTPIDALRVGDCYVLLGPQPPAGVGLSEVFGGSVLLVRCDEPHDQELYHLFALPAGPHPGDELMQAQVSEMCSVQFQNYVGIAPDESVMDFAYVYPDGRMWSQGIRSGGCAIYDPAGTDFVGSMAGSRR